MVCVVVRRFGCVLHVRRDGGVDFCEDVASEGMDAEDALKG